MNNRQRQALLHPMCHSEGELAAPHPARVENVGDRRTILTVSEFLPDVWVWQASVSFAGSPLGRWNASRTKKADKILRRTLDGVGEMVVFAVGTKHKLKASKDDELQEWDVINDLDAFAKIHKSFGMQLPCPPGQFRAMHMWKNLTKEELAQLPSKVN